jgi:hypothetical protein
MSNFETLALITEGNISTAPNIYVASTADSLGTIETSGYVTDLGEAGLVKLNDILYINYNDTSVFPLNVGEASVLGQFVVTYTTGVWSLSAVTEVIPQLVSVTTSSATPGTIRAIRGQMIETATVMTSGNLVGVRGEVDYVGASGGFLYGVQGKLIPTGTLSGSSWNAALFGQFDLSASTLNAGQIAGVWADMGASGGTFTSVAGARMFAGTNTIASLTLNSMIYLYGKASSLFELAGDAGTYITAGAATPSGTIKKIAMTIDGVVYYLIAATVWS